MKCLIWNVRGAARANFFSSIKIVIAINKVEICILTEPRISGDKALKIAKKVGFNSVHFEEARGFLGGIWVCWNDRVTRLKVLNSYP